ncbi:hypothetical protein [Corynebacterium renale]|uniref:hypothetical protein n=1 Tax=Corynebacterium renale TaxID=1724 RepID=UPI000B18A27B|nr:hypothetical protein [Corynebacterium renale]
MKKPAEPNKKNFDEDFYVDVFCKSEYKLWLDSIQDNDATERQKQIHRRSYAEIGIQTKHTWSSEEDERPDWLLATFSLIFPIHPALLADAPHKGEFIDLEGWERGRYHGIKGFTLKSTDSPEMKRTSYYQESGRRFPASFAQSVGADESKPSDTRAEKRTSSKDHGPRFRFYHRRIAEQPGKTSFDLTQQWSNNYRELFEPLAAYPLEGRLTLTGLEFLQYLDTKSDADPNEEPRKSYYLVLHFVAQDCSNDVLTQISEALNRPRNGLRLLNETSIHECVKNYRHKPWRNNDSKKDSHYKLLRYFVDFAIKTVNNSIAISPKSDFPFSAHLTDGGYISGKVSQKWHKVEEKLASPSRIVCAIPGKESITQFPRLFRNANIQCLADDSWAKQTAWAWQLATGSDIYAEAVPNISLKP